MNTCTGLNCAYPFWELGWDFNETINAILYTKKEWNRNKSRPFYENVTEDGRVLNVSGGTAVMKDRDGYRGISRDWIQGWGQGLALAYFAGIINYDKIRSDGAL